jgi:DNA-binding MarR family transcriptional regulator
MDKPLLATLIRRLHLVIRQQIHSDLQAAGYTDLAIAHIYVFQSPGPEGARPTELASRTNMTKQAMNHLLAGLEHSGYLVRVASPTDGRATVIHLTRRGRAVERITQQSSARVEQDWARATGRTQIEQLRTLLGAIDAIADQHPPAN